MDTFTNWDSPQSILVILAHPDDPEFFCGATLALWAKAGHTIDYVLLTKGDKGFHDSTPADMTSEKLVALREVEQNAAAKVIGARSVRFLNQPDGYLEPSLSLRKEIVRLIRASKPDILVTSDPQNLFALYGLNHPDHRYCGQVVLDAAFPAAGNKEYFPDLLNNEGLQPHMPKEIWVTLTMQPNTVVDVTSTWDVRMNAVLEHKSQVQNVDDLIKRMKSRRTEDSTDENPRYEDKFKVMKYR